MPRNRTPNRLKVLRGTDRPDRMRTEPEFEAITDYPEPPVKLVNEEAREEWRRKSRDLVDARVLKATELTALATYCNLHGRVQEAFEEGTPSGTLLTNLRQMWESFGLTPASRSKVEGGGTGEEDNPFRDIAG